MSGVFASQVEKVKKSSKKARKKNRQRADRAEKKKRMDDSVVALRMNREGCNGGELHATLIWNDVADLDLHVITPSGEHMFYGHKESKCGGWLDRDMNVNSTTASLEPIENIFWASSPSGHYRFSVINFNCHCRDGTVFTDPQRSVPFRLRLKRNDVTEWFDGSVRHKEEIVCFEFDHVGSGAIGSFIVIPPNDVPATFKELCEKNGVTYSAGEGYYALKKKENIGENKDMVLHDTESDTFTIGHADVCDLLGWAANERLSVGPRDVPTRYRLFVQSTSHNRKIPKDTHVLMRVSVREALGFRLADRYRFH